MEEETYPLTELDRIANGKDLLILKAMLPWFPAGNSPFMALLIKMMELQNIRIYYQNRKTPDLSAMSSAVPSMQELLQNLIRFSPPDRRESFRQFQNIMETIQMFETMQDMVGGEFSYGEPEYTERTDEQPVTEYAAQPQWADEQPAAEYAAQPQWADEQPAAEYAAQPNEQSGGEFPDESGTESVILDE